jgi:hypothetical protein
MQRCLTDLLPADVLEQLVEQLAGVATALGATEAEEHAFEAGEIAPFGDVPGVSDGLERPGCSRRACQIGLVSNSVPSSEVVHQGVPGGTAPNGVRYGSPFRGAERAALSSINREGRVLRSSSTPNQQDVTLFLSKVLRSLFSLAHLILPH